MPVPTGTYTYGTGGGGGSRSPLGSILHVLGVGVKDLEHAAINSIPGFVNLGKGLATDPWGTGAGVVSQIAEDFRHPLRHPGYTALDIAGFLPVLGLPARFARAAAVSSRAGALPAELATLDAAKTLGRTAEYNRIVNPKTGELRSVSSQVADELLKGLPREERLLRTPIPKIPGEEALLSLEENVKHGWFYSRDPIIRKAQKLVDQAYDSFPEGVPPPIWRALPPFWRTQTQRIASASKAENTINKITSRTKAAQFLAAFVNKAPDEQMAVRLVGEMTTPEQRLSFHQGVLDSGALANHPRFTKETAETMKLIEDASKYLENVEVVTNDGSTHIVPRIRKEFPELQDFVNKAREISEDRSNASRMTGVLNRESHFRRILGPRNMIMFGKLPENMTTLLNQRKQYANIGQKKKVEEIDRKLNEEMGQLSLEGLGPESELIKWEQAEELANAASEWGGGFRIPYKPESMPKISFGGRSYQRAYTGKKPRVPSTYTHPFTGAILRYGGGDANVAKLLAESYTEAHRFIALMHMRQYLLSAARPTPEGIPEEYRQLIATDELFKGKPTYAKAEQYANRTDTDQALLDEMAEAEKSPEQLLLEKDTLTPEDAVKGGYLYEGLRQRIFPQRGEIKAAVWRALTGSDGKTYNTVPGYMWIDRRLLGGLDRRNPLYGAFESGVTKKAIHGFDIANNMQKAMVLYLKPAYALPNLLGNVGLTLVQQGFLAPFNLARTFRLYRTLDKETLAQIRGSVGQGYSAATLGMESGGGLHGLSYRATQTLADFYGKGVDDPFRFSSFLHEAGQAGFRTKSELRALTSDPKWADEFRLIANRANEALINYERLGPGEQAIMRRLVFFYPWVKGSSRYAAQFAKEHPGWAGAHGVAGQQGTDWIHEALGEVPSFAEGLIPYDTSDPNFPIVGSTMSMSILSEPAELEKIVKNVFVKNPNTDLPVSMNLAPMDSFLLALITSGVATTLGHPGSQRVIKSAWDEGFGGNPISTLYRGLRHQGPGGTDLEQSLYPDYSSRNALLRFFLTGALTPRRYNRQLGELKAYNQQHPGFVS